MFIQFGLMTVNIAHIIAIRMITNGELLLITTATNEKGASQEFSVPAEQAEEVMEALSAFITLIPPAVQ
jgi:hypothetical protein